MRCAGKRKSLALVLIAVWSGPAFCGDEPGRAVTVYPAATTTAYGVRTASGPTAPTKPPVVAKAKVGLPADRLSALRTVVRISSLDSAYDPSIPAVKPAAQTAKTMYDRRVTPAAWISDEAPASKPAAAEPNPLRVSEARPIGAATPSTANPLR